MKKSFLSIAAVGLVVVACSGNDTDPTADDPNVVNVAVGGTAGNSFSPAEITIKVGQKVRWTFNGGAHNVVAGDNCAAPEPAKFASSAPNEATTGQFDKVFDTVGDFPYQCTFHCTMNMKGIVHVTP